ncbi:uncharacterized protein LACBIDRAFT_293300 [Laccaria bicolor S238N-H82]|uniref:Predicted protein n=1 Tax=Laccaria bicolor (strain S238N-H82 / ATCC MYA-4686) TaxID=486041 RepID=B0D2S6_LACBS|nr:uncharacterized protein LACBIDRAFT_293300 [Laccaria bicolor S238N-H82]EDR10804.1 predicted protein [Laccaria bicolor S238N-H82]|eukprot:XP_001878105.1 predicted protein [Laccaria bicolor S238N-H82]
MLVYTGKFNTESYAINENIFVVLLEDWVERGGVLVFSTFTKDDAGVEKRPFDLTTQYVLRSSDSDVKAFAIRDLNNEAFYWFNATRGTDTITLNLNHGDRLITEGIELTKLNAKWRFCRQAGREWSKDN